VEAAKPGDHAGLSPTAAPALVRFGVPSGSVGGISVPYSPVGCGYVGGVRMVGVSGITVSPSPTSGSSQQVYADVVLSVYTTSGWVPVVSKQVRSGTMSSFIQVIGVTNNSTVPMVSFDRDKAGYALQRGWSYKVDTRLTWKADFYQNGFYAPIGTRWVYYSDAADYHKSYYGGATTGAGGWCTMT
jgi:hypothetical protein